MSRHADGKRDLDRKWGDSDAGRKTNLLRAGSSVRCILEEQFLVSLALSWCKIAANDQWKRTVENSRTAPPTPPWSLYNEITQGRRSAASD